MSYYLFNVDGEDISYKDFLFRILNELNFFKLWKEKLEIKEKGKERVEIN